MRRFALLAAAFVGILLVTAIAPTVGAPSGACAPSCGHGATQVHGATPVSTACIHDAGCGGAAALGLGSSNSVAALAVACCGVALGLTSRRRAHEPVLLPVGVRLRSGLFRPPRFSFDV